MKNFCLSLFGVVIFGNFISNSCSKNNEEQHTPQKIDTIKSNSIADTTIRNIRLSNIGEIVDNSENFDFLITYSEMGAITDVCYSKNSSFYVAVGEGGSLKTSTDTDSTNWTARTSGVNSILDGVASSDGTTIVVGGVGVALLGTGQTSWTNISNNLPSNFHGFGAVRGNADVIVGSGGKIYVLKSTGVPIVRSWIENTSGTTNLLFRVRYANSLYVVVGKSGTIITSPNITSSYTGIWTVRTSNTQQDLNDAAFGNDTWIIVGDAGTVLTSANGVDWTARSSGTAQTLYGVAYSNNNWVAVGENGTIITSPDGIDWTARTSGTSQHLHAVCAKQ